MKVISDKLKGIFLSAKNYPELMKAYTKAVEINKYDLWIKRYY